MRAALNLASLNLFGTASGFAVTWLVIWAFGLAPFAAYVIDLARVSLILLALELLPSNFSLFRQQQCANFAAAFPAFYFAAALLLPAIAVVLILLGCFDRPSWWIPAYVMLAVVQRYFDCQLQARGQLSEYLTIPAAANVFRLGMLGALVIAWDSGLNRNAFLDADLLWGTLAISLFLSLLRISICYANLLCQMVNASRGSSWRELWRNRHSYPAFYLNSVLKRLKDTSLPLFCDAMLPRPVVELVLAVYRAVDAAFGQLRILESAFTSFAVRARLQGRKREIALVSAAAGQVVAIAASILLLWRVGLNTVTVVPAIIFSFAVYPYVSELLARNDALVQAKPEKVTVSLLVYISVVLFTFTIEAVLNLNSASFIFSGFLSAQIAAAASYHVRLPAVSLLKVTRR